MLPQPIRQRDPGDETEPTLVEHLADCEVCRAALESHDQRYPRCGDSLCVAIPLRFAAELESHNVPRDTEVFTLSRGRCEVDFISVSWGDRPKEGA